ncbi:MAG TPA: STAS domain-containing protein [Roseiflexaceae bacterium]
MTEQLTSLLTRHKARIAGALADAPAAQRIPARSDEDRRAMALAGLDALIAILRQPEPVLAQTLAQIAQSQMRDGVERDDALALLDDQRGAIYRAIAESGLPTGEALAAARALEDLAHRSARTLVDTYHHDVIDRLQEASAAQAQLREAIQELSTPIIPVYNGVLVVPLVGRVDSARAQALTEALLNAIAREQAEIVLLDITGVAVVDTNVANHLMQTARAASLLGSQVVLVGISAEVAQTLVQLGLDLGRLVTLSNLQSGLVYALAQQGLAITAKA